MQIPREIRSQRLVVRPFRSCDLRPYLEFMTDPSATRFLMLEPAQKTESGAKALFDYVMQSYATSEPVWALAIADEADVFIGSCGISPITGTVFECYYSLLPQHWGKGYATEATCALLDYLFTQTNTTEVRAYMSPSNPNSAGVAQRAGMTDHGIQKHPGFGNEGCMYLITKEQWRRRVANAPTTPQPSVTRLATRPGNS